MLAGPGRPGAGGRGLPAAAPLTAALPLCLSADRPEHVLPRNQHSQQPPPPPDGKWVRAPAGGRGAGASSAARSAPGARARAGGRCQPPAVTAMLPGSAAPRCKQRAKMSSRKERLPGPAGSPNFAARPGGCRTLERWPVPGALSGTSGRGCRAVAGGRGWGGGSDENHRRGGLGALSVAPRGRWGLGGGLLTGSPHQTTQLCGEQEGDKSTLVPGAKLYPESPAPSFLLLEKGQAPSVEEGRILTR